LLNINSYLLVVNVPNAYIKLHPMHSTAMNDATEASVAGISNDK